MFGLEELPNFSGGLVGRVGRVWKQFSQERGVKRGVPCCSKAVIQVAQGKSHLCQYHHMVQEGDFKADGEEPFLNWVSGQQNGRPNAASLSAEWQNEKSWPASVDGI